MNYSCRTRRQDLSLLSLSSYYSICVFTMKANISIIGQRSLYIQDNTSVNKVDNYCGKCSEMLLKYKNVYNHRKIYMMLLGFWDKTKTICISSWCIRVWRVFLKLKQSIFTSCTQRIARHWQSNCIVKEAVLFVSVLPIKWLSCIVPEPQYHVDPVFPRRGLYVTG